MVLSNVLDCKVVHNKAEHDGPEGVTPKAWSVTDLVVSVCGQLFCKWFVGKDAGLGQAVHVLSMWT